MSWINIFRVLTARPTKIHIRQPSPLNQLFIQCYLLLLLQVVVIANMIDSVLILLEYVMLHRCLVLFFLFQWLWHVGHCNWEVGAEDGRCCLTPGLCSDLCSPVPALTQSLLVYSYLYTTTFLHHRIPSLVPWIIHLSLLVSVNIDQEKERKNKMGCLL